MDMTEAIIKWKKLGTTASWDAPDGCYYILFIDQNQTVKGHIKTIPGQGWSWVWPDELLA
jgi:hypothetical protein